MTEFAPDVVDPVADVARGRRGLRRRRTVGGLAAVASVVAVAALGAQYVPLSSAEPPIAGPTSTPTVASEPHIGPQTRFLALHVATVSQERLGSARKYLPGTEGSASVALNGNAIGQFTFLQPWKQSGGTGLLWVSVAYPRQALAKEKWCGPSYTPDLLRMTCTERLAPNGRRVLVGSVGAVQNSKGDVYRESGGQFVRYVRPDGQVVIAAALGMNSLKRVADGLPKGVKHPDVTWQQLAAVATDPSLSLGK